MKQNKPLKPPLYRITAMCSVHGIVTVDRKPNPKAGQRVESGGVQSAYPGSVVCPFCVFHARVLQADFIGA
jgi:hypothetical protein